MAAARHHSLAVVSLALVLGAAATAAGVWLRHPQRGQARSPVLGELATDAGVALVTGAILGLVLFPVEEDRFAREQAFEEDRVAREQAFEQERAEREERRDNIRFVREIATQPDAPAKPFAGFDLRSADLAGLALRGTDLAYANLLDASLRGADLRGADLTDADLFGADLASADLFDADLASADLRGADLRGADLTDAVLANIAHDDSTVWPQGFAPPPSR